MISLLDYMKSETPQTYSLSFTAATLRVREMVILAEWVRCTGSVDSAINTVVEENHFQLGSVKSSRRFVAEMKLRLIHLPESLYEELPEMSDEEQKQLCFLATCLTYPIFQSFVDFINSEKLPLLDMILSEDDVQSFFYREEDMHDELYKASDHTKAKVRQVLLNIFTEIGVLDANKPRGIYRLMIEPRVEAIIQEYFPEMKRIFLAH